MLYIGVAAIIAVAGLATWAVWDGRSVGEREKLAAIGQELVKVRAAADGEIDRLVDRNVGQSVGPFIRSRVDAIKEELTETETADLDGQIKSSVAETQRFLDDIAVNLDEAGRKSLSDAMRQDLDSARAGAIVAIDRTLQELADRVLAQVVSEFMPRIRASSRSEAHAKLDHDRDGEIDAARAALDGLPLSYVEKTSAEIAEKIKRRIDATADGIMADAVNGSMNDADAPINARIRELMKSANGGAAARDAVAQAYRPALQKAKDDAVARADDIRRGQEAEGQRRAKTEAERLAHEAADLQRRAAARKSDELRVSIAALGFAFYPDRDVRGAYPHSQNSRTESSVAACATWCRGNSECDGFSAIPSGKAYYCMLFRNSGPGGAHAGVMSGVRARR